jgi:hypothetical protein
MMARTVAEIPDGSDALAGAFLAADYYGGQFTALYAVASSGSLELYSGEGLDRLRRELVAAVAIAEQLPESDDGYLTDAENLGAFLAWVEANAGD